MRLVANPHGGGSFVLLIPTMLRQVSRAQTGIRGCEMFTLIGHDDETSASSGMTALPSPIAKGGDFAK